MKSKKLLHNWKQHIISKQLLKLLESIKIKIYHISANHNHNHVSMLLSHEEAAPLTYLSVTEKNNNNN